MVVVNGDGGLDDPALESRVRMVRLDRNTGPAGGFRAGMVAAFEDPDTRWAYLCEDDVGLFALPSPRVARTGGPGRPAGVVGPRPVGAVVAYGRASSVVAPTPSTWSPRPASPTVCARWTWPAGGPPWWPGRWSRPGSSPTPSGSSASRTSTSSAGCAGRVRGAGRCGGRRPGGRPADQQRTGRRPAPAAAHRRCRGVAFLLPRPELASPWPAATDGRAGTPGTWPTRRGSCRRPPAGPNGRPSSTGCGTVPGDGWASTPATSARWGSSTSSTNRPVPRTYPARPVDGGAEPMCGIAGLFDPSATGGADSRADLTEAMAATLAHRGPDAVGFWADTWVGDLPSGTAGCRWWGWAQRAASPCARPTAAGWSPTTARSTTIAALRRRLAAEGRAFRGGSDTEVLVARRRAVGPDPGPRCLRGHVRPGPVGPPATVSSTWSVTGSARSRSTTAGWAARWPSPPS